MIKLLCKPGFLHKMQRFKNVYLQCQGLPFFPKSRSAQLHKCSQQSQGKWSDAALSSRLHPRILIIFILLGMSDIIGSNLVRLKSLERGQLALSGLCEVPHESNITLLKSSLPQDLGTLPYSTGWDRPQCDMTQCDMKIFRQITIKGIELPNMLATSSSFYFASPGSSLAPPVRSTLVSIETRCAGWVPVYPRVGFSQQKIFS